MNYLDIPAAFSIMDGSKDESDRKGEASLWWLLVVLGAHVALILTGVVSR